MVAWQPVGLSMGCYDMALRYLQQRKQFGTPLAAFQLMQVGTCMLLEVPCLPCAGRRLRAWGCEALVRRVPEVCAPTPFYLPSPCAHPPRPA